LIILSNLACPRSKWYPLATCDSSCPSRAHLGDALEYSHWPLRPRAYLLPSSPQSTALLLLVFCPAVYTNIETNKMKIVYLFSATHDLL
jgi:hypothetical protein